MLIAIEGCCHGELEDIYRAIADREKRLQRRIDLLIICGDFQAVRNAHDLESLACPPKYRRLGIFADYYTGKRRAPVPTVFIGGNHEASNYLTELYLGGWVCPNIYYLGHAGVIRVNGLRIGGLSGIYNYHSYHKGHYELPPYDRNTIRSVYHTRYYDVLKLMQIEQPLDIFVSHDWPQGIEQHGDTNGLIKRKPFFAKEPNHWYSAHLHVKFTASVHHPPSARTEALRNYRPLTKIGTGRRPKHTNPDELTIDTSDSDSGSGGDDVEAVSPVCKPLAEPQARPVPGRARLQLPPPKNTTSADVVALDISASDGETPVGHSVATQPPQLTQAPTTAPGRSRLVLPPPAHTASPLPSLLEIGHSEAAPEPATPTVLPTTVEEGTQPPSVPNTTGIAEPVEAMPMEVESVRPDNQVAPPQPIPSDLSTVRQWPRLASHTRYFGTTEFLALDKCLRGRQFLE
ncbi:lariat debranching enzyme, partial [Tieghemiomyces parasiticus]